MSRGNSPLPAPARSSGDRRSLQVQDIAYTRDLVSQPDRLGTARESGSVVDPQLLPNLLLRKLLSSVTSATDSTRSAELPLEFVGRRLRILDRIVQDGSSDGVQIGDATDLGEKIRNFN